MRSALARRAARICKMRGVVLLIAGDWRLAASVDAGLHLRGGQPAHRPARPGLRSAAVHNAAELRHARGSRAGIIFISPVFMTQSHPGAEVLGAKGWRRLARQAGMIKPLAMGGITGKRASRLGKFCYGIGAIDAFL